MTAVPATTPPAPDGGTWIRLPWRASITGAVVVTLLRPLSWALGLAGFLAGGGLLLVAWPILVLPTPTGLQNALGGPVSSLVFGSPTPGLVLMIAGTAAGAVCLLVLLVLTGAWAERQGITVALDAAVEEALVPGVSLAGAPGAGRVATIRLLALAPVAAAVALAWQQVYDATYHQLVLPDDLRTPLPVRVMGDIPWLLAGIAVVWLLSDAAASVAVRRLVLERRSVIGAWLQGWADLARRPGRIIATELTGLALLVLLTGPALAVAGIAWTRVRDILAGGHNPVLALVAVLAWVAIWLCMLLLTGVAAGIRASTWTLELPRRAPDPGASPD